MTTQILESVRKSAGRWYMPLISGIIFMSAGILAFFFGKATFLTLTILFSLSFLMSGIFEVTFSVANRKEMKHWGWSLILGIISVIFGVLLLANPFVSMFALVLYVGLAFLFRSISGIILSIDLKKTHYSKWWLLLALSILGVVFSVVLILHPFIAGKTIIVFTGVMLIVGGIFSICLSVLLKKIKKLMKNMDETDIEVDVISWFREQ